LSRHQRRHVADLGKLRELLVDLGQRGRAGVNPQAVAELQRLARLDRPRGDKGEGGAHPAVVANMKDRGMIGILQMIQQHDPRAPFGSGAAGIITSERRLE
jgi:hypothetical protein